MTINEVKDLFYKYKNSERSLRVLRNRLRELREDMTTLASSMGNVGMPSVKGSNDPKLERMLDEVLEVEKRYLNAIDEFMLAEERLADAFNTADLTSEEKDVLVESYMNGKPAWKVAMDIGWSERTVKRRRINAVKKLTEN